MHNYFCQPFWQAHVPKIQSQEVQFCAVQRTLGIVKNTFFLLLHKLKPPKFTHEVRVNISLHKLHLCKMELKLLVFICSFLHLFRTWQLKTLFHSLGIFLYHLLTYITVTTHEAETFQKNLYPSKIVTSQTRKKKKGLTIIKDNKMNIFNDLIHHWYNGIYHGIVLPILGILLEETKSILAKTITKC